MGRSEAPLPSDSNGEESLEEPTENTPACVGRRSLRRETTDVRLVESLRGVDSKYNEQGSGSPLQLNSDYSLCKSTTKPQTAKATVLASLIYYFFTLNNNNTLNSQQFKRSLHSCTFSVTKSEVWCLLCPQSPRYQSDIFRHYSLCQHLHCISLTVAQAEDSLVRLRCA